MAVPAVPPKTAGAFCIVFCGFGLRGHLTYPSERGVDAAGAAILQTTKEQITELLVEIV